MSDYSQRSQTGRQDAREPHSQDGCGTRRRTNPSDDAEPRLGHSIALSTRLSSSEFPSAVKRTAKNKNEVEILWEQAREPARRRSALND